MTDTSPATLPAAASEQSPLTITPGHLSEGLWHVRIDPATDHGGQPALSVVCQGRELPDVTMQADGAGWLMCIPLPMSLLSDGVHTIVIIETASGVTLQRLHIAAGAVLDDDLRAEISLLRAELDVMKQALRRHCADRR